MENTSQAVPPENQRSALNTWYGLAVIAVFAIGYLLISSRGGNVTDIGKKHPAVGRKLMQLSLHPLTGDSQELALADLRGNVVLINYWGPWCYYCIQEFPHLIQIEKKFRRNRNFLFLSVSCNERIEDLPALKRSTTEFLADAKAEFPTYSDPGAVSRNMLMFSTDMPFFGYPTTVLLDSNGNIQAIWSGYESGFEKEMDAMLDELLKKTAQANLPKSSL